MNVRPEDGVCRSCGGRLQIADFDDVSITVSCLECADAYAVEADAFGDGSIGYLFPLIVERAASRRIQRGDNVDSEPMNGPCRDSEGNRHDA